ncbi:MAG: hypothetical protein R2838_17755 [Caldilineaceae bacterium]
MTHSREVHLKRRPVGLPTADAFELVTVDLPAPGGPGSREESPPLRSTRTCAAAWSTANYTPPFQLGEAMTGGGGHRRGLQSPTSPWATLSSACSAGASVPQRRARADQGRPDAGAGESYLGVAKCPA